MKIAVIGSGISGLSCAWQLSKNGHDVTLYEANDYFGGHTHTVDVELDGMRHGVDTGFLVFNERTYPNLIALFKQLDIDTSSTDMSFSVKLPLATHASERAARTLEWAGANLNTVFAQRRNLFNPAFFRMLKDIMRFNKQATQCARSKNVAPAISLGDFLRQHQYSQEFCDWYLLPMAGCIWSCPTAQMLDFPLMSFVQFCDNHGLLQVSNRPKWGTVTGGAKHYVEKMLTVIAQKFTNTPVQSVTRVQSGALKKIRVELQTGSQLFDHVVMACHSDQSLALLSDANSEEAAMLSAVGYQPNVAVLHTDVRCLPAKRSAWSAWNYESQGGAEPRVCVHYLLNKLQPLPFKTPVIVSLNPLTPPDPASVIGRYDYAHPVFDAAAIAAQRALKNMQGHQHTWFAGAWTGYGFHEDGLKSGLAVAHAIEQVATVPSAQLHAS